MSKKGFTLIEVLVVIAVVATITLVSFPAFSLFSAQLSLNAAARAVASDLRKLQSRAMLQHETLQLPGGDLALPPGIQAAKPCDFSFAASGAAPPGGSGTLVLKNRFGRQKKIIVSAAGRVRIE